MRSSEGDEILMKVIQGRVTSIIPADSRRFGRYWKFSEWIATSVTGRQVDPLEFAQVLSNCDDKEIHSDTIVISFGCFASGHSIPSYV